MIYKKIKEIIETHNLESEIGSENLAKLAFYNTINQPYFKNFYDFVNLYKDIDDNLDIGQDSNNIERRKIFDMDTYPVVNKKTVDSKTPVAYRDFRKLLNTNEQLRLTFILETFNNMSSISEVSNLTVYDLALLEKIRGAVSKDLSFQIIEDLISGPKTIINKRTYIPQNGTIDVSSYKSFLENHAAYSFLNLMVYELTKSKPLTINMSKELINRSSDLSLLLQEDNLQYLLKENSINYLSNEENTFLDKFKSDLFKDTYIGILLADTSLKEKVIQIFDKMELESYKRKITKIIENYLEQESINHLMSKEMNNLEMINNTLMAEYIELNQSVKPETTIIPYQYFQDKNTEEEVMLYSKKFCQDHLNSVGIISDLSMEFNQNGIDIITSNLTAFFYDNIDDKKPNSDLIVFKNNIEFLGCAVLKYKENEGTSVINIPLHKFKKDHFTDDELIDNYQQIVDYCKNKNVILNFVFDDFYNDDINEMIKSTLLLEQVKKFNKDSIIINIANNSIDYTQLYNHDREKYMTLMPLTKDLKIEYKDLIKTINKINDIYDITHKNDLQFNKTEYQELVDIHFKKYKSTTKNIAKPSF